MKRWHEDAARTLRQWRKHYLDHVESNVNFAREVGRDPYEIDCVCDVQKGRFRKKRAFDCGHTRCQLCHADKYPRRHKTRQELLAKLKFREGLADSRHVEPAPRTTTLRRVLAGMVSACVRGNCSRWLAPRIGPLEDDGGQ
jgi:hypothetical protein